MSEPNTVAEAKDAIDAVYFDNQIPLSETIEHLKDLSDLALNHAQAIKDAKDDGKWRH